MIGYFITRSDCPYKLFAGTNAASVAVVIESELTDDFDSKLPADALSTITLEAVEITQEEIDNMPEFEGW